MPSIISEHDPHIPSRQSCENAIGSSPRSVRCSLTTSSISRNDMSGLTSGASYFTSDPGALAFFWRQTWRVSFMLLVAPLAQRHVLEHQRLLVQARRRDIARVLPGRDVRELRIV